MLTSEQIDELIDASLEAKSYAYCPYSKFRVGCAILTTCGKIIKGCNVENVSIGLTICAERTAYTKAVSDGYKSFKAVAITSDVEGLFTYPCGACRQFMSEFGDIEVIVASNKKEFESSTLNQLLPKAFDIHVLESNKCTENN